MSLEGGTRYIFFETSTTDGAVSKNAVVKVYSANGTDISSISYSTTANENVNNKVTELTDRNKSSENSYPSNKAVSDYVDALSNKIDTDITELEQNIANKADKTQTEQSISNIQNQVNNLITPVTQDAEVQNARVGADGHSYSTLKERLDTEQTSVKEDLNYLKNYVTPEMFGAVGDGIADDTIALQSAINAIGSGNVALLYIPNGTYAIKDRVIIDGKHNISIICAGTIIPISGEVPSAKTIHLRNSENVYIKGLKMDGNLDGITQQTGYGTESLIEIQNCTNVVFVNTKITNPHQTAIAGSDVKKSKIHKHIS